MPASVPPDGRRCTFTSKHGKRCRSVRVEGDTLCYFHFSRTQRQKPEPDPGLVAAEILSPEQALDSAQAVNTALTRVFRLVLQGRLSTRHATTLGYVAQLILFSVPQMQRQAQAELAHQLLGSDPEAALTNLAHALRRSVGKPANGGSSAASAENSSATAKSEPPDDTEA